jgi:hypothetical protein
MNLDDTYEVDELPAPPRKDIPAADRELLELAARALGAVFVEVDGEGYGNLQFPDGSVVNAWNPLQFSGDTFDLQVQLGLTVRVDRQAQRSVAAWDDGERYTEHWNEGIDERAATRRAVTRAAAEIAKACR